MPYRSRSFYKNEEQKVRDYNLFIIVTEGTKREVEYLFPFDIIDRIKVVYVPWTDEDRGSAPNRVLARMDKYIRNEGISTKDNDTLWCVIDVDQWEQESINALAAYCKKVESANLIISNPCFEVWLLYHVLSDLTGVDCSRAQKLKKKLGDLTPGGYDYHDYIPLMPTAITNAKVHDKNPDSGSFMPDVGQTKMYLLAEHLMKCIGIKRWAKFKEDLRGIEVVFKPDGTVQNIKK